LPNTFATPNPADEYNLPLADAAKPESCGAPEAGLNPA